jgi:hypothetical protein
VQIHWDKTAYKEMLLESLPQAGVGIFNAVIARLDWILLGILSSNIILAEYSFANKVFEMATSAAAGYCTFIDSRITKIFQASGINSFTVNLNDLQVLLKIEILDCFSCRNVSYPFAGSIHRLDHSWKIWNCKPAHHFYFSCQYAFSLF